MKKAILFAFLLLLLGCVSSGIGTQPQAQLPAYEQTLRLLDNQERTAVLNRDRATLELLWSDQLTVNAPSNQVAIGKRTILDLVERGVIHYSSFERTIEFVRIDNDLGIIMGAETVRPTGNAPLAGQTVQRRFTNIWKREAGTWRMIARHANAIPPR